MDKRRREDRQEGVLEIRIFWGDTAWCPQKTQYVVLGETSVLGRHFCALGRHFRLSSEGTCVLLEQTSSEGILCPGETLQAVVRRHMCPGGTGVLRRHIVSLGDTAGFPQKAQCVQVEQASSEGILCPWETLQGVVRRHNVSR